MFQTMHREQSALKQHDREWQRNPIVNHFYFSQKPKTPGKMGKKLTMCEVNKRKMVHALFIFAIFTIVAHFVY